MNIKRYTHTYANKCGLNGESEKNHVNANKKRGRREN